MPACAASDTQADLRTRSEAVIYGTDDRLDVYAEPEAVWRERAQGAAVALIETTYLSVGPDAVTLAERPLAQRFVLCDEERFGAQPSLADCSATLIDEDLVLTAGHCFSSTSETQCERYHYVFGYAAESASKVATLRPSDVYACKRILARKATPLTPANSIDYAIVQLDRPVEAGRKPLPISARAAQVDEAVTVMGFPSGLPLKLDHGGRVRDAMTATPELFSLDSDTFAASSGSGVFDAEGKLVGSIVSGRSDYRYLDDAGCQVARRVDAGAAHAPFEQALHAGYAVTALCEAGWPNLTFCGRPPSCGDGFCSTGERLDCVADCGPAACTTGCVDAGALLSDAGLDLTDSGASPLPDAAHAADANPPSRAHKSSTGCAVGPSDAPESRWRWVLWTMTLGAVHRRRRKRAQ